MWIVKLGGSLATDDVLRAWLRLLASPHGVPIAVVPGGGAFADCVREQQARWRFPDATAHAMALLAMAQYGLMLASLRPGLAVAKRVSELPRQRGVAVWLPLDLLEGTPSIEASWDVTSDSLAAWLAQELDAERLVLVKSCAVPSPCTIDALADAGIVDRSFAASVRGARYAVDVVEKHELDRIGSLLAQRRAAQAN